MIPPEKVINNMLDMYAKTLADHGGKYELADLAIFYFIVGEYRKAAEYANEELKGALGTIGPLKIVQNTVMLDLHRKALVQVRDMIMRQIGEGWGEKSAEKILEILKARLSKYAGLNDYVMLGLIKEFAGSVKKFYDTDKRLLEPIMKLR